MNLMRLLKELMNIGTVGSGNMRTAVGRIWANQGHQVILSYSRNLEELKSLARKGEQRDGGHAS